MPPKQALNEAHAMQDVARKEAEGIIRTIGARAATISDVVSKGELVGIAMADVAVLMAGSCFFVSTHVGLDETDRKRMKQIIIRRMEEAFDDIEAGGAA